MGIAEGQVLDGKYRVERVLGQGGMGVVVAAHHLVLDEAVAIKFLLPEALRSAEAVTRFEREARAAVKIKSEHVARVTDVGRLESGAPYMVMELLRGRDLGDLLQQQGPLRLEDVADYVLQAGEAIAEAHGLGIVHRDLKPSNLFMTQRADGSSCIKVLDFGISKLTVPGSEEQGMTSTAAVMGSPLYMSPEQLMSARDVDMRTDIWALGVICFELLTGKLPFAAETLPQLCMAISLTPPTPVRNYRPDLPLEVEAILLRCLSKDRDKRYATVAELANELVRYAPRHSRLSAERIDRIARASGFPASTIELPPASGAAMAVAETNAGHQTIGEFGQTRPGSSASRARWGIVLGAVVLAAGGAAAFVLSRPAPRKPDPVPASAALPEVPPPVEPIATVAPAPPEAAPVVVPSAPPVAQPSARTPSPAALAPWKPAAATPKPVAALQPAPASTTKPTLNPAASSPKKPTLGGRL